MLLKSLQYFWVRFWGLSDKERITRVSGETYWNYRLFAEGLFFAVASIGLLVLACIHGVAASAAAGTLLAGPLVGLVGLLEMSRLARALREQVEFAELFYG